MTASEHTELLPAIRQWHWDARAPGMVEHPNGAYVLVTDVQALLAARALPDGAHPASPSLRKDAVWCQPGDKPDRHFIVRFEDQDRGDAVFTDEAEAREFYARATVNWNCWLFGAMPVQPDGAEPVPVAWLTERQRNEIIGIIVTNSVGGTDDFPAVNLAGIIGDLDELHPTSETTEVGNG
jgi:hypothetical protein